MKGWGVMAVAPLDNTQLSQLSTDDLAWLTHECEHHNDDVSMGRFNEFLMNRPEFGETYRTIWPQHAKARGYHK